MDIDDKSLVYKTVLITTDSKGGESIMDPVD